MTASEVLAQSVWQTYAASLGISLPPGLADEIAQHQLSALKAAGYSLNPPVPCGNLAGRLAHE